MLDGDRIATLLTRYLKKLLDEAQVKDLDLAIIQTAYANGSSTEYIRNKLVHLLLNEYQTPNENWVEIFILENIKQELQLSAIESSSLILFTNQDY